MLVFSASDNIVDSALEDILVCQAYFDFQQCNACTCRA